jgi:hypothetical protein
MPFDPDEYLAKKKTAFDPDAYLANKQPQAKEQLTAPSTTATQRIISAGNAPLATIQQGIEQAKRGNVIAGGANIASGAISAPFAPISSALQAVREIPFAGNIIANMAESPFRLGSEALNLAGSGIQKGLDVIGVPKNVQNFGLPERQSQEASQAVGGLTQSVAPLLFAPKIGQTIKEQLPKAVEATKTGIETRRVGKAQEEIKRVAPPTSKELNYDQALKRATPYIAEQHRANPITSNSELSPFRQATEIVADAKAKLWDEKIAPQIERHANETIDGKQIADNIRSGISKYVKEHEPTVAQRIEDYARTFENYDKSGKFLSSKEIPLSDANSYIKELNAKTRTYQKGSDVIKAQMEAADPNVASKVSAVEALRDAAYDKLESFGEKDVRELRKDYGSLAQIHRALERRIVPAERGTTSSSFYAKPFGTGVATAATVEGFVRHPKVTSLALVTGILRKALLDRDKPNPTIERAFGRLGKTSLEPRQVSIPETTPTDISQQTKDLPPLNPETGNPAEPTPPTPPVTPTNAPTMPPEAPKGGAEANTGEQSVVNHIASKLTGDPTKDLSLINNLGGVISPKSMFELTAKSREISEKAGTSQKTPQTGENPQISNIAISNTGEVPPETRPQGSTAPPTTESGNVAQEQQINDWNKNNAIWVNSKDKTSGSQSLNDIEKYYGKDAADKLKSGKKVDVSIGNEGGFTLYPSKSKEVSDISAREMRSQTSPVQEIRTQPESEQLPTFTGTEKAIEYGRANPDKLDKFDAWKEEAKDVIKTIEFDKKFIGEKKAGSPKPTSQNTLRPAILKGGKLHIGNIGDTHDNIKTEIA